MTMGDKSRLMYEALSTTGEIITVLADLGAYMSHLKEQETPKVGPTRNTGYAWTKSVGDTPLPSPHHSLHPRNKLQTKMAKLNN